MHKTLNTILHFLVTFDHTNSLQKDLKLYLQGKKIDSLKKKEMASTSENISVGVQTILFEEDIIRCKECEYPAEDIYGHIHEFHGENTKKALDCHRDQRDQLFHFETEFETGIFRVSILRPGPRLKFSKSQF